MTKTQKRHLVSWLITFISAFLTPFTAWLTMLNPNSSEAFALWVISLCIAWVTTWLRAVIKLYNENYLDEKRKYSRWDTD